MCSTSNLAIRMILAINTPITKKNEAEQIEKNVFSKKATTINPTIKKYRKNSKI